MNGTLSGMIDNATGRIVPIPAGYGNVTPPAVAPPAVAKFNLDARTAEEHCANISYLQVQSQRWLEMVAAMPDDPGVLESALNTAIHLGQCVDVLVGVLAMKRKVLFSEVAK